MNRMEIFTESFGLAFHLRARVLDALQGHTIYWFYVIGYVCIHGFPVCWSLILWVVSTERVKKTQASQVALPYHLC